MVGCQLPPHPPRGVCGWVGPKWRLAAATPPPAPRPTGWSAKPEGDGCPQVVVLVVRWQGGARERRLWVPDRTYCAVRRRLATPWGGGSAQAIENLGWLEKAAGEPPPLRMAGNMPSLCVRMGQNCLRMPFFLKIDFWEAEYFIWTA